jgi:formylglycine-generating enzyme required for sulfatase activity
MLQLLFVDIEKFPVTNAEYWEFCEATNRDKGRTVKGRPRQPVVYVSWFDAMDYACWRATRDGIPWRLPTEEELAAAERLVPEDTDFSAWPLPELPDVDAHPEIVNSLGHECLLGVIYQWTMREEDKAVYDKMWAKYLKRREKREVNAEITARGLTFDAHTQVNMGGAWYDAAYLIGPNSECDLIPQYMAHNTGFRLAADGDESIQASRGKDWGSHAQTAGIGCTYGSSSVSRGAGRGFRLAADTEADRVSRGGSWSFTAVRARAAYRYGIFPGDRKNRLGFRLAVDTETDRVYRGGGWDVSALDACVALRRGCDPTSRFDNLGFRLVVDMDEASRVNRGSGWDFDPDLARVAFRGFNEPAVAYAPLGFRLAVSNDDSHRVRSGGSWDDSAQDARVADRGRGVPADRVRLLGFRLAVDTVDVEDRRKARGGSHTGEIDLFLSCVNPRARKCFTYLGFRLAVDTDNNKEDK